MGTTTILDLPLSPRFVVTAAWALVAAIGVRPIAIAESVTDQLKPRCDPARVTADTRSRLRLVALSVLGIGWVIYLVQVARGAANFSDPWIVALNLGNLVMLVVELRIGRLSERRRDLPGDGL